jgi:hypothetical protein
VAWTAVVAVVVGPAPVVLVVAGATSKTNLFSS